MKHLAGFRSHDLIALTPQPLPFAQITLTFSQKVGRIFQTDKGPSHEFHVHHNDIQFSARPGDLRALAAHLIETADRLDSTPCLVGVPHDLPAPPAPVALA